MSSTRRTVGKKARGGGMGLRAITIGHRGCCLRCPYSNKVLGWPLSLQYGSSMALDDKYLVLVRKPL